MERSSCVVGIGPKRRRRSINDVTDDVLTEILFRLPVKLIHQFKLVSRRWFSLISSPSFARSFNTNNDDKKNKMILFKVERRFPYVGQLYALPLIDDDLVDPSSLPFSFDFIPQLMPQHNYKCNPNYLLKRKKEVKDVVVVDGDRSLLLVNYHLVGNYGGLLLLKAEFANPADVPTFDYDEIPRRARLLYYYYVCNPITKQWVELPRIPTSDVVGFTCYSQQEQDSPTKIDYTVVSIHQDERARVFVIHVLSSTDTDDGWNMFRVPFPPGWTSVEAKRYLTMAVKIEQKAVFVNGKFHWVGKYCIAAYDPFNKPRHCDIIPLPPMENTGSLTLAAFEGILRLALLRNPFDGSRLEAWDLDVVDYYDDDGHNKFWVKTVDVEDYADAFDGLWLQSFLGGGGAAKDKAYMVNYSVHRDGYYMRCGFKNDTTIILDELSSTIILFDPRNKSRQQVYEATYTDLDHKLSTVEQFISSPWPTRVCMRTGGK